MASMLVNRFKLRRSVLTYSLGGMGCSASLICVDMAKHQLKVTACVCEACCACWPTGGGMKRISKSEQSSSSSFVSSCGNQSQASNTEDAEVAFVLAAVTAQHAVPDCEPREHLL